MSIIYFPVPVIIAYMSFIADVSVKFPAAVFDQTIVSLVAVSAALRVVTVNQTVLYFFFAVLPLPNFPSILVVRLAVLDFQK